MNSQRNGHGLASIYAPHAKPGQMANRGSKTVVCYAAKYAAKYSDNEPKRDGSYKAVLAFSISRSYKSFSGFYVLVATSILAFNKLTHRIKPYRNCRRNEPFL